MRRRASRRLGVLYVLPFMALLLGNLLAGLREPTPSRVVQMEPRFDTTESAKLFFKNIRSVHYDHSTLKPSGIDIFRPRWNRPTQGLGLEPFLVNDWRRDQAYVMFDVAEWCQGDLRWGNLDANHRLRVVSEYPEDAFRFTMKLYQLVSDNQPLHCDADGSLRAIWDDRRVTGAFRRLVRDYLELVGAF